MAVKREEVPIPLEEMEQYLAEHPTQEAAEEAAARVYEEANPGRKVVGSATVGGHFWLTVIRRPTYMEDE